MRTRRPSRFQRQAQSRAAASPGSSPSASTITSRTRCGQIESAQPGGRKRRPGRMAGRLHGGEAGLDAFADHQHVARARQGARRRHGMGRASSSADRPAPCRRHRGRGRCGGSPAASSSAPLVTSATIAGQMPPEGCFRPAWKRSVGAAADADAARGEIGLDQRSVCRLADCQMASAASLRLASPRSDRWFAPHARWARRARECFLSTGRVPGGPQSPPLVAAGVATNQDLAAASLDRQARLVVVMRRAARHPRGTSPKTTECPSN